jgi:hypothetical protein
MKLFRLKSIKFRGFNNLTHAYFCSTVSATPEHLISTTFLINEKSGQSLPVIDHTHYILSYINKGILFPRNSDVHHISEDVVNSLAKHFPHIFTSKYYQHSQNRNYTLKQKTVRSPTACYVAYTHVYTAQRNGRTFTC